jgi:hypothetical protein
VRTQFQPLCHSFGRLEGDGACASFQALGRFGEPRLRRAMEIAGGRTAESGAGLLRAIAGPNAIAAILGE